jgi:hypothetical protein
MRKKELKKLTKKQDKLIDRLNEEVRRLTMLQLPQAVQGLQEEMTAMAKEHAAQLDHAAEVACGNAGLLGEKDARIALLERALSSNDPVGIFTVPDPDEDDSELEEDRGRLKVSHEKMRVELAELVAQNMDLKELVDLGRQAKDEVMELREENKKLNLRLADLRKELDRHADRETQGKPWDHKEPEAPQAYVHVRKPGDPVATFPEDKNGSRCVQDSKNMPM